MPSYRALVAALPAYVRYETTGGQLLHTAPLDPHLYRQAVVSLDASDVLYQIVEFQQQGDALHAQVERYDDPGIYEHFERSDPSSLPATHALPSTDGVELAHHHIGGDGPPLLICHATGFHALAYAPLARSLRDSFDVWALDMRGHGSSTAPASGDFSWRGMAEDVLTAVESIGSQPLLAIGHSMGGAALLLAEIDAPGTLARAYLWEPIVFPGRGLDGPGANPMSGPARKRRPAFESKSQAFERYAGRAPLSSLRIDALAAYVEHGFIQQDDGSVTLACTPDHEARTFEAPDKPTLADLHDVLCPVAVASGAEDPAGLPEQLAPAIADALARGEIRHHGHLGHLGPLQDPAFVARDVLDFFTP